VKDVVCGLSSAVEAKNRQQHEMCDVTHKNNMRLIEEGCENDYMNCAGSKNWPECYPAISDECKRFFNEEISRHIKARDEVDSNYPVNQDLSNICDMLP